MDLESDSSLELSLECDTDDELELEFFRASGCDQHVSSGSSTSNPGEVQRFVAMGFPEKNVIRAIKENGENDTDAILNALLKYSDPKTCPGEDPCGSSKLLSLSYEKFDNCIDVLSDGDSCGGHEEESRKLMAHEDRTISLLVDMGYQFEDALAAVKTCGYDAPIEQITDFIYAAEIATKADTDLAARTSMVKKRKFLEANRSCKRPVVGPSRLNYTDSDSIRLHKPMVGFGVPGSSCLGYRIKIPDIAAGPPYFYYENVALTPKGVWDRISRFLYDIKPEFVDSIHFSAAVRKRGYIHNLPTERRHPLLPIPPKTIHEALPTTKRWWPRWDKRTKLNCLLTCIGSAKLTERIRNRVEKWDHEPPMVDQKYVIQQCKKWNLVWVGKNKVAVLEPDEMEKLLGFPENHTRGGGISRTDRYKALGNSFQVDTVAYHLSVLKPMYPYGMNILSLFSGIGGAEVALHKVGIPLKNVVSVEISPINRKILQDWWNETEQEGNLIHVDDVQKVDPSMIDKWISDFNGFDLIIGGSPCNNLAGGNRRARDGLSREHSSLFFHYYRILDYVRSSMRR